MIGKGAFVPARVFISHSHRDRSVATDLQKVLTKFGAQTFLDQDKIQGADVLPDRIQEGVEWCDTFLLIWSSSAAASDWVDKEWNRAYERRRKIIPYCLDSTSLPPVLENLVFVDQKDARVAHAGLLRAVFGKGFTPPSTDVFPGRWRVTLNAFGLGKAIYDLELRGNGQITGSGTIDQGGVVGDLVRSLGSGPSDMLNLKGSISGTWEYEEVSEILTLDITAYLLGQSQCERIQIRTTGREVGEIQGKDLSGRTYAIRRMLDADSAVDESDVGDDLPAQNTYKETEAEYSKAIELDLVKAEDLWDLGDDLTDEGKYREAEVEFRKAIDLDPDKDVYRSSLGYALSAQGKHKEAEVEYTRCVELKPDNALYRTCLGNARYAQGKYREAEVEYREATQLNPDNGSSHFDLGAILFRLQEYREAEVELRKAIELEPDEDGYPNYLGNALYAQGKYREAEVEHRKAIALDPDNAFYHYDLGATLYAQGWYRAAEVEHRKAIQLDSDIDKKKQGYSP